MMKKHLYPVWLITAAKSGGLLVTAALAGCLSNGSELIPAEAGSSNTNLLVVTPDPSRPNQPSYRWNIGTIAALDVVRTTNPSSPVWGFSVDGGADLVPSPVTHGTFPVNGVSIASSEPVLTAGVQYRVHIRRNTTNQDLVATFTPPNGSGAALTRAALAARSLVTNDGTAWTLGAKADGTASSIALNGLDHVIAIAAGANHSLAITADGGIWSWGSNISGQLGNGSVADSAVPVRVTGLPRAVAVAAGDAHSVALADDGTVWAWGDNSSGQVGDGTNVNRATPVRVEFLGGIVAIAAGKLHSMALAADGTVWNWGGNYSGQLGNGTTANNAKPVAVTKQ